MDTFLSLIGVVILFILVIAVVAILCALPVMLLWNALMPDIFGLTQITFWQALGLSLLSSLLFKNWSSSTSKD